MIVCDDAKPKAKEGAKKAAKGVGGDEESPGGKNAGGDGGEEGGQQVERASHEAGADHEHRLRHRLDGRLEERARSAVGGQPLTKLKIGFTLTNASALPPLVDPFVVGPAFSCRGS